MTKRRPILASCAGTPIRVRQTVSILAVRQPAAVAAAREMLCAMKAKPSHAALAVNFPEGRCSSSPVLSSSMVCSMLACCRWVLSAATVSSAELL